VKAQIWIAISIYVLVAIIKKRLNLDLSLYTILQIFSVTLFEKLPLIQLLANFDSTNQVVYVFLDRRQGFINRKALLVYGYAAAYFCG